MKKTIVFFCMLHTSVLFSQSIQENITKIDTTERNLFKFTQVKSVTINSYDIINGRTSGTGMTIEKSMFDPNGNKIYYWEPVEFEYNFKYDPSGNRIEAINKDRYYNNISKELWTYDTQNNCIQYLKYLDGKCQEKYEYRYNSNNRCIEKIDYNQYNNSKSSIFYTYNLQGLKTDEYAMQNASMIFNEKRSYDAFGNMTEQINYLNNSINWRQVYKYDNKHILIEATMYDANNKISSRNIYSYNTDGKLLSQEYYNQTGKLFRADNYSYSSDGKLMIYISNIEGITHYKYNDKGLLVEKKHADSQIIKYTYDYYSAN